MTRTERASYPRALNRDRSESRNGLDSSLRKRGAGNYNWGSLADEHRLESTAQDDEENELVEEEEGKSGSGPGDTSGTFYIASWPEQAFTAIGVRSPMESEASSKSYIERSASASSNPSSSITEEDREKARNLRKNAFKKSDRTYLEFPSRITCV